MPYSLKKLFDPTLPTPTYTSQCYQCSMTKKSARFNPRRIAVAALSTNHAVFWTRPSNRPAGDVIEHAQNTKQLATGQSGTAFTPESALPANIAACRLKSLFIARHSDPLYIAGRIPLP